MSPPPHLSGGYNQSGNSIGINVSKTKLMSLNASKLANVC